MIKVFLAGAMASASGWNFMMGIRPLLAAVRLQKMERL
jgi:hypothetical protein